MSVKMNCIIADDEPLARKGMEKLVAEIPFLNLIGSCSNPFQVMTLLEEQHADLLFLDVQMPRMTGLEFLRSFKNPPITIITTAYQQYALEGYELAVTDYLVKPISLERFTKAVNKAREFFLLSRSGEARPHVQDDYCFIKCDSRYEKIIYDDILFIEATQNYVTLQMNNRRLISYLTFKSVEEYLPSEKFLKVHKSYIVSLSKVEKIEGGEIRIGAYSIPISRQHKEEVITAILQNKVIRR